MVKRIENFQKPKTKFIELQNLFFENKKTKKLDLNSPEYELHSKIINRLYDFNFWHYPHNFKDRSERLTQMVTWFGSYNFKTNLPGNRESYVWAVDVNDSVYCIYLTPNGLFIETSVNQSLEKVWADVKELSKILLEKWKKKLEE